LAQLAFVVGVLITGLKWFNSFLGGLCMRESLRDVRVQKPLKRFRDITRLDWTTQLKLGVNGAASGVEGARVCERQRD
jgi:hypothetical protein